MTTWVYRLNETAETVLSAGIHGLWRFLCYIKPEQTDSCYWELTEDTITFHWQDVSDLNALWGQMTQLHHGIAVPPGYCTDLSNPGIYTSVRAHLFLTTLFRSKSGASRTTSMGEQASEKSRVKAAANLSAGSKVGYPEKQVILQTRDRELFENLVWAVSPSRRIEPDEPLVAVVTPHFKGVEGDGLGWHPLPEIQIKTLRSKEIVANTGNLVHPAFTTWNSKAITRSAKDVFAMFFSPYAYVCTHCNDGILGVAMTFPTFAEADAMHRLHGWDQPLHRVNANTETAITALLAHLECPENRTYNILTSSVSTDYYYTGGQGGVNQQRLVHALRSSMTPMDDTGILCEVPNFPLHTVKDTTSSTLYDQLVHNVKYGLPWYSKLNPLHNGSAQTIFSDYFVQQNERQNIMAKTIASFETPNERMARQAVRRTFTRLAFAYKDRGISMPKAWDRANLDMVHGLGRARTEDAIFKVLADAGRVINGTLFDAAEMEAIRSVVRPNPAAASSLLILACITRNEPTENNAKNIIHEDDL